MKPSVLLLQLPVPNNPALNTPLAAGYLKAYAYARGLGERVEIEILPRTIADSAGDALLVEELVARRPDVLGLSLYTWNSERSLEVAHRVRERLPDLLVIAGGPELQADNAWLLNHPALDIGVIGEGEQTFVELLEWGMGDGRWGMVDGGQWRRGALSMYSGSSAQIYGLPSTVYRPYHIPGLAFRDAQGRLVLTEVRQGLDDLAVLPSPYLEGYLELPADGMLMVEISRWCPYSCSFCLYGRNMGPRLGSRYFALKRVLDEIAWAQARGIRRVHFVEANLNLVPIFWPLMHALADRNADRQISFYAELRGEHLTDEVVAALDAANVRYVEVGLQSANPAALSAGSRRTNLAKWAAGTRRLYQHGIEVYLDVILGLPADDEAGVQETLAFIEREELGSYDIFMLQLLPGTAVRRQSAAYQLRYQERPPYYLLAGDRLAYSDLRRLRYDLKRRIGLDPAVVEGMPEPRREALDSRWWTVDPSTALRAGGGRWTYRQRSGQSVDGRAVSLHTSIVIGAGELEAVTVLLAAAIKANPSSIFDIYLQCDEVPPPPEELAAWRAALPYQPGYLDRVAVYLAAEPGAGHVRVSPRLFLVLPWTAPIDPQLYIGVAGVIWRFEALPGEPLPLRAWRSAGGAGIWLQFAAGMPPDERAILRAQAATWEGESGRYVWCYGISSPYTAPNPVHSDRHLNTAPGAG